MTCAATPFGRGARFSRGLAPAAVLVGGLLFAACGRDAAPPSSGTSGPSASSVATATRAASAPGQRGGPPNRDDSRFIRIRNLLEKDPESVERATRLYPLVEPICKDEKERADFIEVAKWSSSFSIGHETLPTVLALDTIEHVATSCSRNHFAGAIDLLERAKVAVPDPYRFDVLLARLRAANGELPAALVAAQAAAKNGSVHALALTANIQAQIARGAAVGYKPGMLDDAIKTVAVEPDGKWQVIDLTAVLSTHAHLLNERSLWEPKEASTGTRRAAAATFRRLAVAPFIETTRALALDILCLDAPEIGDEAKFDPCGRAAEVGILGGAVLSGKTSGDNLDRERLAQLQALAGDVASLPRGAVVLVGFRGDESELLTWARPAAQLLQRLKERGVSIILYDRTRGPRAAALVDRILEMAGAKPAESVRNADTLAMPCLAAIMAGRQSPAACSLEPKQRARLERSGKLTLAFLVGRDLDAEIDDLKLYAHKTALLSFRQTQIEKGLSYWLKSLSDIWIVTPPSAPAR